MIDFEKIGKYRVTGKLGQGSFGVVYRGRDAYLKRDVAIKVCSVADEGLRRRFFREAEISGKLVHKNIVTVYEFGFEGEVPYLVQELLSGEDLSPLVKRRAPLSPGARLDVLLQVAAGLGYAHSEGVIHRDIKPGNVRVLEDGGVKIMDFGIAKLASAETQLTQRGVTMGTASYLPPEQVRGADVDHRADIFSFGVLAYELMTYQRPFRGNTLSALVYQILYKVPQSMSDVWPEAPGPLADLVARCLEKKPERRFDSFTELIPELEAVREGVAAGRWPALAAAAGGDLPSAPAGEPAEASEVVSQAAIAETARGALEGKVGDYTISTAAVAREVLRPPSTESGRSTRPVAVPPADAVPAAERPDAALATRVLTPPPPPAGGAAAAENDLAATAQEIGELVAQGQLEAAKEQLEATLDRTGLSDLPAPETAPSSRYVDAGRETVRMPLDAETVGVDAAGGGAAAEAPEAGAAPEAPEAEGASDTYRTLFRPPLDRLKWAGLAAAAVLAAALGWFLLGGGETQTPPSEPGPEDAAAPAAAPEPVTGGVAIRAVPWAEVTEITDAAGYLQDLPPLASTPLYLELAPGSYTIHLRAPGGERIETCDVEITPEVAATCAPAFGETDVVGYFKESGWWR